MNEAAEGVRYFIGCAEVPGNVLFEQYDHLLLGEQRIFIRFSLCVIEIIIRFKVVVAVSWVAGAFFGMLHVFSFLLYSVFLR